MDKSIFKFIWKYSKRDQIILLMVTLLTFPILYVSLELPKRIINDAIGGSNDGAVLLGVSLSQVQFLLVLCAAFLVAVLVNGLLKMRLNTMKGVLAERLLRRFRYQLLTRILRFPRPYFRSTSQGELVSMVTSEAEPLGGIMGDMLSQPVLQAGQTSTTPSLRSLPDSVRRHRLITLVNCIFRFNLRFYSILESFLYRIWFGLAWEYSGIWLQPLFCCGGTPQGLFFSAKSAFSVFLDMVSFQKSMFLSKTQCWGDRVAF